jgi:lysophospholipase L1-like esterase
MSPGSRSSRAVSWARIAILVVVAGALAAFLWWPRRPTVDDSHRSVRQLILHFTLARVDDPIIVLGDSIVEASGLPRSLCGHPVVNAGLSGASTASDLGPWLAGALAGKRAALILIALGTNDALMERSRQAFAESYTTLLTEVAKLTPRVVVLAIPTIEAQGRVAVAARDEVMATINGYNSALAELAEPNGARFAALPVMPEPHTIDGVHLSAAGYLVWDKAVLQGAASVCNPG